MLVWVVFFFFSMKATSSFRLPDQCAICVELHLGGGGGQEKGRRGGNGTAEQKGQS